MSSHTRGETQKRDRPETSPSITSPSSRSPATKKLNFKMPPKPKIIRTKPELAGKGDAVLRELHHQHFNAYERSLDPTNVYVARTANSLMRSMVKPTLTLKGW